MKTPFPQDQGRLLKWESCNNTRELGGYSIAGGGQVRWKTLLRSDSLALLTPEGQTKLLDYGVRTIIDLRFDWELKEGPNPFAFYPDGQITYLNIPLDEDANLIWPHPGGPSASMSDMYIEILERNHRHIAAVMTAIAHAGPGGVLFHCYAGKDRTGLISALVLSAIGVSRETVIMDYSLATETLAAWRKKILEDPTLTLEKRNYTEAAISTFPETMQRTLEHIDQKYGSVEGYLKSTPLQVEDFHHLRSRLVEE